MERPKSNAEELPLPPDSEGQPQGTCSETCPLCIASLSHNVLALLVWLSRQPQLSPEDWDAMQWHLAQGD